MLNLSSYLNFPLISRHFIHLDDPVQRPAPDVGHSAAGHHIAEFAVVNGLPLARLGEIELGDFPRLPVDEKLDTLVQIACSDYFAHFLNPSFFLLLNKL
jgi:hypothetical protein